MKSAKWLIIAVGIVAIIIASSGLLGGRAAPHTPTVQSSGYLPVILRQESPTPTSTAVPVPK